MSKKTTTESWAANPFFGTWQQVMGQQMGQVTALCDQVARQQQQAAERASQAMTQMTEAAQGSLALANQMSQSVLEATLGTTKLATEMMSAWRRTTSA